ncbi:MAG: phosphoglucomutase/phosphomannomutase family protein [Deltaproteobacteria bacterium]|nr:phosphoglucomutase/phosphomannomutase family protein [Deltaproteobacteria bacterium]
MKPIQFGTDGWRAIIDDDFIPANIAAVAQAFADLYPELPKARRPVVVGYDRRRRSREAAESIAGVLLGNDIPVHLAEDYCPTPCVTWHVVHDDAAAGIMVTASHNPPNWNGIKFKESYGGAAAPAFTDPIEARIRQNAEAGRRPKAVAHANHAQLRRFNPRGYYVEALTRFVNLREIETARFTILADPMYGAGVDFLPAICSSVTQIHTAADSNFGGIHPEPIVPYVNEAIAAMQGGGYDLCVITDGDADRIGAIDGHGRYVTSHEIYALLLQHCLTARKWRGGVVKSITTTRMIDRLCRAYQLPLTVTPVGFKHISPALNRPDMLIGGEESGGIGLPRHMCERDGLLCGLLLLEMMALSGRPLHELVADCQSRFGPCHYRRIDCKLTAEQMRAARDRLAASEIASLGGRRIAECNRIDGYHFLRDDESWLLIRPSGTEPLLRTYAEARTMEEVEVLLNEAQRIVGIAVRECVSL